MNIWIGRDSWGEWSWNCQGHVHTEQDERYVMDEFGTAVNVPFSGRPDEYLEH